MIITYKNSLDCLISEAEALSIGMSGTCYKLYTDDDGVLKREDSIEKGSLKYVEYYKGINETETEIVDMLSGLDIPYSIHERITIGNSIMESGKTYQRISLKFKYRYLYDQRGNVIGEEDIDPVTNKPVYEQTKKFYYNYKRDPDFPTFSAHYKANGSLDYIDYELDEFKTLSFYENGPEKANIPALMNRLNLTSSQMDYYLKADLDI